MKKHKKIVVLSLIMTIFLVSCGTTKKSLTTTNAKKENLEVVASETKTEVKKETKDSTNRIQKLATVQTDSKITKIETKTKIVLKAEKDSAGNIKPAIYKRSKNGKIEQEISINGKGEVTIETTETATNENSNKNHSVIEKNNSSLLKNASSQSEINSHIKLKKGTSENSFEERKKTNSFILFKWWFWLIVILILTFIWWLNKQFPIFGFVKRIFQS